MHITENLYSRHWIVLLIHVIKWRSSSKATWLSSMNSSRNYQTWNWIITILSILSNGGGGGDIEVIDLKPFGGCLRVPLYIFNLLQIPYHTHNYQYHCMLHVCIMCALLSYLHKMNIILWDIICKPTQPSPECFPEILII